MFKFTIDHELELRLLELNHAQPLFQLIDRNRKHLREWLPWVDGTQQQEDSDTFIRLTREKFASSTGLDVGIWWRGELVGVIGFHDIDRANRKTTIGYWLGKEYEGNGIMTRATKALIRYALDELNMNRITIQCAEGNTRSRAIPERLGFTQEGITREGEWLYDHYVDYVVYGLLKKDITQNHPLEQNTHTASRSYYYKQEGSPNC
ncbi:GNAT family N-acetyltransferase [Caldalkalibacillus salinus]|uniref:GNAT family N-acetyltransferase n=1 Tax=Caldalkalibacillus salinus TaxID=2803787 RepID=UPI0019216443|nr:GNAT family protein [Caldalkalibacillus salinus]